jgi:RNA polymerase sigma-70 factor (ECF subfamily)
VTGISTSDFGPENDYEKGIGDEKIPAELAGDPGAEGSDCIRSIRSDASPGSTCLATRRNPKETSVRRSDEDLMVSVKEGNSTAFETLTKRHYTNTLNFIYRFVNNRMLAEDLCQETFLRLWRSARSYQPLAKLTTFLYHIAKNVCLKQIAKDQRAPYTSSLEGPIANGNSDDYNLSEEIADNRYLPEKTTIAKEADEAIRSAIGDLSAEHRLVFVLTELQGLSYQEVAEIARCPVGTVASRKNAAVRCLQRRLHRHLES